MNYILLYSVIAPHTPFHMYMRRESKLDINFAQKSRDDNFALWIRLYELGKWEILFHLTEFRAKFLH